MLVLQGNVFVVAEPKDTKTVYCISAHRGSSRWSKKAKQAFGAQRAFVVPWPLVECLERLLVEKKAGCRFSDPPAVIELWRYFAELLEALRLFDTYGMASETLIKRTLTKWALATKQHVVRRRLALIEQGNQAIYAS